VASGLKIQIYIYVCIWNNDYKLYYRTVITCKKLNGHSTKLQKIRQLYRSGARYTMIITSLNREIVKIAFAMKEKYINAEGRVGEETRNNGVTVLEGSRECNEIFSDSKGYISRHLYTPLAVSRFSSQVHDHTYISHRVYRTCVHWRQETSLVDDFCHDKTSNIFVETTDPYTHIYRSKKYLYVLL